MRLRRQRTVFARRVNRHVRLKAATGAIRVDARSYSATPGTTTLREWNARDGAHAFFQCGCANRADSLLGGTTGAWSRGIREASKNGSGISPQPGAADADAGDQGLDPSSLSGW
jgi:hypothetical protein